MVNLFFTIPNSAFDFGLYPFRAFCAGICADQQIDSAFAGIVGLRIKNVDPLNVGLDDILSALVALQHRIPRCGNVFQFCEKVLRLLRRIILTDPYRKLRFTFFYKARFLFAEIIPFRVVGIEITLHRPFFLFSMPLDFALQLNDAGIFLVQTNRLFGGAHVFINLIIAPDPLRYDGKDRFFNRILRHVLFPAAFVALPVFAAFTDIVTVFIPVCASAGFGNHFRSAQTAKQLSTKNISLPRRFSRTLMLSAFPHDLNAFPNVLRHDRIDHALGCINLVFHFVIEHADLCADINRVRKYSVHGIPIYL